MFQRSIIRSEERRKRGCRKEEKEKGKGGEGGERERKSGDRMEGDNLL